MCAYSNHTSVAREDITIEHRVVQLESARRRKRAQSPVVSLGDDTSRLPHRDSRSRDAKHVGDDRGSAAPSPITKLGYELINRRLHAEINDTSTVISQARENVVPFQRRREKMLGMTTPQKRHIGLNNVSPDLRSGGAIELAGFSPELIAVVEDLIDGKRDDLDARRARLRGLRHMADPPLSQEEAGEQIGCGRTTWSNLENGITKEFGGYALVAIADYFNVTTDWLLGRSGWAIHPETRKRLLVAIGQALIEDSENRTRGRPKGRPHRKSMNDI